MISKELLSEVLDLKINLVESDEYRSKIYYYCNQFGKITGEINIYELAHKCKEYARSHDYYIESVVFEYGSRAFVHRKYVEDPLHILNDKNEPAVIFKACEWIMEEGK